MICSNYGSDTDNSLVRGVRNAPAKLQSGELERSCTGSILQDLDARRRCIKRQYVAPKVP